MSDSDDPRADEVRQAAIEWWVSHKAGLTQEERAAFGSWLAADPAHAAAFADIAPGCIPSNASTAKVNDGGTWFIQ